VVCAAAAGRAETTTIAGIIVAIVRAVSNFFFSFFNPSSLLSLKANSIILRYRLYEAFSLPTRKSE
jgi:Na+-transporting NADH:ubiquinone oxidoreductase subunit NqrD